MRMREKIAGYVVVTPSGEPLVREKPRGGILLISDRASVFNKRRTAVAILRRSHTYARKHKFAWADRADRILPIVDA